MVVEQNPLYHRYDVWNHTAAALDQGDRTLPVGWAILLHDIAKGREGVRGINKEGQPSATMATRWWSQMAHAILHGCSCRENWRTGWPGW